MAGISVKCIKCGEPVELTQEMFDQITEAGAGFGSVAHDVCPGPDEPKDYAVYRAEITITKTVGDGEPEVIASAAANRNGKSLESVVAGLTKDITERWETVVQHAAIAD